MCQFSWDESHREMLIHLNDQTLNDFINSATNTPDWPKEALDCTHIRLVDSLDITYLSSPTRSPYEELPSFPFLNHTPQTINDLVQATFPGTALNCVLFIILDSFSVESRSCVIACNKMREEPFLMLVRVPFRSAISSTVSTTCTGLTFESMTEGAMRKDGISEL